MNKDLISETNTRYICYLSGDHDTDMFLTKSDMSESHWQLLMGCYHPGACDDDAAEASLYFDFKGDSSKALRYLIDCGCEPEQFEDINDEYTTGKNEDAILRHYLWMISGDIQEYSSEVENE